MKEKLYKQVKKTSWIVRFEYSVRDEYGNWKDVDTYDRFRSEEEAKAGYEKRHQWMFESYHLYNFMSGDVYRPEKKEYTEYVEVTEEEAKEILEV